MRAFIDTNVLLDVLAKRSEFVEPAKRIFTLCEDRLVEGWVSALSLCDCAYVLRKFMKVAKVRENIRILKLIFTMADIDEKVMDAALASVLPDFEDSVQLSAAQSVGADVIVTRDKSHFRGSPIKVQSPDEFLASLGTVTYLLK